jgi:hypothetical protein
MPPKQIVEETGQIKATDRRIDALVYELYEFTEREIGVVEGSDHK